MIASAPRRLGARVVHLLPLGLALLVLLHGAEGVRAGDRAPVKSLLEMRRDGAVVQQWDLSCGAAALATLLRYQYDDRVTEHDVALGLIRRKEYVQHPELVRLRQGFSLLDMKRYVDGRGYAGLGYGQLDIADLERLAPIIVAINPIGYNHFVVFRGIEGGAVLLADPAFGNRTMTLAKFRRVWIVFPGFGRVGFIVTRDGKPGPAHRLAPRRDQFVAPSAMALREVLPLSP
jgi:uncharacterized protein